MAGQNFERREVLRILSLAAGAAQFPGFERWAFACPQHPDSGLVKGPAAAFQPRFFDAAEYQLVEILCDIIVPNDGTPGAKDAGVSEFIDFMAFSDPEVQYRFRYGLGWLNAHGKYLYGKPFAELPADQQTDILTHLAYRAKYREGEEDGRAFFELIREYTMMGFYTSKAGLEELDYPGLKMVYDHMPPGCPHHDDRQHKHLNEAKG
ncbi:MAG TPA: gluconate 2-dehydrogenase subunit 3 family protein [Bryobacteraceae bacterium]|jgi:hypothetical protein|nr:gluconate 2-dehydrogenase subunit 3 family protein [Bryobacteraceae bacterium]